MPWTILAAILLLAFSFSVRNSCIPPMEYIIRGELGITHAQTGFLYTIPIIMMAVLSIPTGILADQIGLKKTTGLGATLFAVGCVLRGFAIDYSSLIAFSFIVGTGGAFLGPNISKFISRWVPKEKTIIAMGIFMSVATAGNAVTLAITLPLIYPITNTFQGTFLIFSIPAVIASIVWWASVRNLPGVDISSETMENIVPLRQVLGNKNLWMVAIYFFLCSIFFFNWIAWAPALMIERGATPATAALISSVVMWVIIPTELLMPRFANKLGLRKPLLWIPSIALTLVPLWAMYITVNLGWLLMIIVGILDSIRTVVIRTLPIEMMPRETIGTATGMIMSLGSAGGVIGPLIGGYILDLTGSINSSLMVMIWISVAAVVCIYKIPETGQRTSFIKGKTEF
ncbi:CynX/NimT family MFS transporter [Chloroflexota bacterium]